MKALRALRTLPTPIPYKDLLYPTFLYQFFSAQPQEEDHTHTTTFSDSENDSNSVFDSIHYTIPAIASETNAQPQPTWDEKYRTKADELIFSKETQKGKLKTLQKEERRRRVLAKVLLEAALEAADDKVEEQDENLVLVTEEDQKSLLVRIIGAPNARKSALTNYMVDFVGY